MSPLNSNAQPWPWPDSLDALTAAPDHHELLFENDVVRVIITHIPPGDFVPLHTHRWSSVVNVLSSSDFIRRDENGAVLFDSRKAENTQPTPPAQWSAPLPPHTVENVGQSEIRLYMVELKEH